MCGDWWISILGLCQFLSVCGLSILVIILIKGNEKRNRKGWEKGSKYDWTTDKNKEQVDFVHKTKSTFNYWIEVQFDYWIIHLMNGLLNQQTESFFHLFIRLATAMLDMLWLTFHKKKTPSLFVPILLTLSKMSSHTAKCILKYSEGIYTANFQRFILPSKSFYGIKVQMT